MSLPKTNELKVKFIAVYKFLNSIKLKEPEKT